LLLSEPGEKIRIALAHAIRPDGVVFDESFDAFHVGKVSPMRG
jgi:hypothetical protein